MKDFTRGDVTRRHSDVECLFQLNGPGHDDMICDLIPIDDQVAAIQDQLGLAVGFVSPRGADKGRASTCAASSH